MARAIVDEPQCGFIHQGTAPRSRIPGRLSSHLLEAVCSLGEGSTASFGVEAYGGIAQGPMNHAVVVFPIGWIVSVEFILWYVRVFTATCLKLDNTSSC